MFSRRNLNKTKTYGQKTLKKLQISIEEPVVCVVVFSYYVHTIVCRTIQTKIVNTQIPYIRDFSFCICKSLI